MKLAPLAADRQAVTWTKAHPSMETFQRRLKRYVSQDDLEIFGWLTVYLQNDYLRELRAAREGRLYLSVYLVTHSIIQMVSENLFGLTGKQGSVFFLEHFVDGDTHDLRFSLIGDELHDARNVMAHQGFSSLQHRVEYFDDTLCGGWARQGETVHINPAIYAQHFEAAIIAHGWVKEYRQKPRQARLIQKYRYIGQWLRLGGNDPIAREIKGLSADADLPAILAREAIIQGMIYERYGISESTEEAS